LKKSGVIKFKVQSSKFKKTARQEALGHSGRRQEVEDKEDKEKNYA
jgi:hypothetical protein